MQIIRAGLTASLRTGYCPHDWFELVDKTCVYFRYKSVDYNPGQNYLRKFSPSCPLSYAAKLFPKRRLCGKKTPSPNSLLFPTNAQGSGFLLNTQQHCFQGKGEREEPVQLRCLEKCCPIIQFSQPYSFVQDWSWTWICSIVIANKWVLKHKTAFFFTFVLNWVI